MKHVMKWRNIIMRMEMLFYIRLFYFYQEILIIWKIENSAEIFGDVIEVQKEKDYLEEEDGAEEDLKEEEEKEGEIFFLSKI
jgi:hypothetical protein